MPALLGESGREQANQRRGQQNITVQQLFAAQPEQYQRQGITSAGQ